MCLNKKLVLTYYLQLLLRAVITVKCNEINDLLIQLPQGKIQGHILHSPNGKPFYAFQEIPYAAPPIGENRFKEPKLPERWSNILNATRNKNICMQTQKITENLEISEDCLFINVYSPTRCGSQGAALPVLVWIHGGAFKLESGAIEYYQPHYLMEYDVVVVTFNYRLGPFGFLSTSDGVVPGNLGIKDQVFALQWVRRNIRRFGGDKNKITIMGSSAGAMAAGYIQVNEQTKGLIKGFILSSGSPLSPYSYQSDPDYFAFKLAKNLDSRFNSSNTTELLELLQKSSAIDILSASNIKCKLDSNTLTKTNVWLPIIENENIPNALIKKPTLESLIVGDFAHLPMLLGTAEEEAVGLIFDLDEAKEDAATFDKNINLLVNSKLNVAAENSIAAGNEYRSVYTSSQFSNDTGAFIQYLGEEVISTPSIHHAVLASSFAPVYFYQFSYKGSLGHINPLKNISGIGTVGHTEDLFYIFGPKTKKAHTKTHTELDQLLMKRMLAIITNFVKYQNPTPIPENILQFLRFPQIKNNMLQYLVIDANLEIKENPKHYSQVKKIFIKYGRRPYLIF